MTFGSLDSRGIFQYGEDDTAPNFSQLLNMGQESVSDALRSFSGTPAQREAMNPAPEGATWQDTTGALTIWRGEGGVWIARPDFVKLTSYTPDVTGYQTGFSPAPVGRYGRAGDLIHVEARSTVDREASRIPGVLTVSLPVPISAAGALVHIEGGGYLLDNGSSRLYDLRLRAASVNSVALEVLRADAQAAYRASIPNAGIAAASLVSWRVAFTYLAA